MLSPTPAGRRGPARWRALPPRARAAVVALLAGSAGLAALVGWGLTGFARYSGRPYASPDAYVFWSLVLAFPLLSGAVVIYRRRAEPPVGAPSAWAWWAVMGWLPWSWFLLTFLPQDWTDPPGAPLSWLRHWASWTTITAAAAAGLVVMLAWLWRTRRAAAPPATSSPGP